MLAPFLEQIRAYNDKVDVGFVTRAFDYVNEIYKERGGDILCPLDVLDIILPLKPDDDTIVTILLYDLCSRDVLSAGSVRVQFGDGVYNLLIGLRKILNLSNLETEKNSQIEILRRLFIAMAKDVRVVLIALAARLYMMRNFDLKIDKKKVEDIAKSTLDIYVPIASRLGIYRMRTKLEDLSFKFLHPEDHEKTSLQLENFNKIKKVSIDCIIKEFEKFLSDAGIEAEVSGRIKSIYSIHKKLIRKNFDKIDDLYDVFAIRIIAPSQYDENGGEIFDPLYSILGVIHGEWEPISKCFKDYIVVPKSNGYQSLHTVILGLSPISREQPVEVQIRSSDMHRYAEYGFAAHWSYKQTDKHDVLQSHIDWIRGLQQFHDEFMRSSEIMREIEIDLFGDRIFVLTPRGDVKDLALGATIIDFAYAVHTDVGNHCVMAKVDGKIVPLDHELQNGEVVEIITRKDASPKLQWFSFAKTPLAKQKIKAWFNSLNKEGYLKEGRRLINNRLAELGKPLLDQNYTIFREYCGKRLSLPERELLVQEVGKGSQLSRDVVRKVYPAETTRTRSKRAASSKNLSASVPNEILVGGESELPVKMAACCNPSSGDMITAYVTRGNRVTIHKAKCCLLDSLDSKRIIHASWKDRYADKDVTRKFRVRLKVEVAARVGLMRDMAALMADSGIFIADLSIRPNKKGGLTDDYFALDLSFDQMKYLDELIVKLSGIEGVVRVSKED